jgi:hypothetical protein
VSSKPPLPNTAIDDKPPSGKPVLEWEEVVLDVLLQTLRERRDRQLAEQLKKANRLN